MSSPRSCWYHTSHRNQLGTIAQESCLKSFMFSTASIIWFTFSLLPSLVFHRFVSLFHYHIISTMYASPRPSYMQKSCMFFIIHLLVQSFPLFPWFPSSFSDSFSSLRMCICFVSYKHLPCCFWCFCRLHVLARATFCHLCLL